MAGPPAPKRAEVSMQVPHQSAPIPQQKSVPPAPQRGVPPAPARPSTKSISFQSEDKQTQMSQAQISPIDFNVFIQKQGVRGNFRLSIEPLDSQLAQYQSSLEQLR